jgi:hypothetical protein
MLHEHSHVLNLLWSVIWAKLSWQDGNMSLCGRDEEIRVKRGWQDGNVICMEEMIEEG